MRVRANLLAYKVLTHLASPGLRPPQKHALIAALEEVRANGFATNYEESEDGVGSVAIALRDAGGVARAAVAVAVPTTRLSGAVRKEIASVLVDQAKQLVV